MHGDFIHRNLPNAFITTWDEWLQLYIAGSREQMGEEWLNTYLTSPIWRFVLSSGVIDASHWTGIMLPSVDQVGRYYPFSIVMPLPIQLNPLEFFSQQTDWFEQIEELALQALNEQHQIDELVDKVNDIEVNLSLDYQKSGELVATDSLQITMASEEPTPSSVYSHFLDSLLSKTMHSYSLWSTRGSERIAPCLLSTQGLPSVDKISAMMDGEWSCWGWSQPYAVK